GEGARRHRRRRSRRDLGRPGVERIPGEQRRKLLGHGTGGDPGTVLTFGCDAPPLPRHPSPVPGRTEGDRSRRPPDETMSLRDIHTPVLLDRCVELLAPALEEPGAILVDATL